MNEEQSQVKSTLVAERGYRCAILCGVAPLILGTIIFLSWWQTRADWLMIAGGFNIIVGLVFVSVGLLYLGGYGILAPSGPDKVRRILACLALYVSNFFGAGAIIIAVIVIQSAFAVEIRNNSRDAIRDAELVGGGCRFVFDRAIPPGGVSRRTQWIKHDDEELKFTAQSDHRVYRESFPHYVTSSLGGFHTIVVNSDRSVSFEAPNDLD